MNLYNLSAMYREDVAKLQDLDMPPEAVLDTIDSMQGELTDKIKAVMIVAMEMEKLADARKECAKAMLESAKSVELRAEGLRSYAQIAIQNCGLTLPLKYPEFTINLRKNPPSCTITDIDILPEQFKSVSVSANLSNVNISADEITAILSSAGLDVTSANLNIQADKRAVLDALKKLEDTKDKIPGASINPTSYRVAVK